MDGEGKESEQPIVVIPAPTAEEQMETLKTQLGEIQGKLEKSEKSYKGLQTTVGEKDRQLKERVSVDTRIDEISDRMELLATALATTSKSSDNLEDYREQKDDTVAQLKQLRKEQDTKRKQSQEEETRLEYNRKADAIYTHAKEVFKDDDEGLERVEDLLYQGRLERAEARVSKSENTPKPKETDKGKEIEEAARRKLEEAELLNTDTGLPAGGTTSDEQFIKDFSEGKLPVTKENVERVNKINKGG